MMKRFYTIENKRCYILQPIYFSQKSEQRNFIKMDLNSIYQTMLLFGVYIFRKYFSHKLAELIYIGQISVFECKVDEKDDEKMKIKQENIDNK